VEGCCLRIEREGSEARKIAERTFYTPCILLSFSRKRLCILCVPPKFHNLPSRGNITNLFKWFQQLFSTWKRERQTPHFNLRIVFFVSSSQVTSMYLRRYLELLQHYLSDEANLRRVKLSLGFFSSLRPATGVERWSVFRLTINRLY